MRKWLDRASAQALTFAARRLLAERIAILFAVREPSSANELSGLPELVVGGLAGGFGLPDARPLARRVEETFVSTDPGASE
jgi:hypothetical protein